MKPGLVRRMAMTSSAMGTVSSRSSRAVYLPTTPDSSRHDDLVGHICQGMHPGLARLMAMTSSAMGTVSSCPAERCTCHGSAKQLKKCQSG